MVCLGFEHGAAGWYAQTVPLSYGGTPPRLNFESKQYKVVAVVECASLCWRV